MKNIAVVCALPPTRNTGMATVDLAAHALFKRFESRADVTFYTYGTATRYAYQPGDLPFAPADIMHNAEAYHASDMFVFWGDFIHSRSYLNYDRGAWDAGVTPAGSVTPSYGRHVFLSDTPQHVVDRSIVFGSTIITNEASDALDCGYQRHFDRLFTDLGAVFFRDAMSAAKIAPLRGMMPTLGCDCAFLLEDQDLEMLPGFEMARSRQGVGVFFGRSQSKLAMLAFSRLVARELGEECRWLPWFWSGRRLRWPAQAFGYDVPRADVPPGELLAQLSGCRFVITDTYHMCINAWRLGIPAICIGQGAGVAKHSLADKKKEVVYEMYGARPLYVFSEALRNPAGLPAVARRVAKAVSDTALTQRIGATIAEHRAMAGDRLMAAIERGLGSEQPHDTAKRGADIEDLVAAL